jgi:hypothetical protein
MSRLATCLACKRRFAAIESGREAYLDAFPPGEFARQVVARAERAARTEAAGAARGGRRPDRRRWLAGLGGLALALGVVALFVATRPADEIRLKGVTWQVVAKRGERTWLLDEGAALQPGDRLAFSYGLPSDRSFLLLGVDDAGHVSRYGGDGPPLRLARGAGSLPFAVELDERAGQERLFGIFSIDPIDGATAKRALEAAFARAHAERRAVASADLGLRADVLTLGFSKR